MGDFFMESKRPRRVTGPLVSDRQRLVAGLGDDVFEQDRPADQRVAAVADPRLDGQVQVVGFAGKAADFLGGLG
jgi:hypothetical protein